MMTQTKLTNIGQALQAWARGTNGTDLGKKIEAGGNKYMRDGEHDVKVAAVDCNQAAANNKINFKYENREGQEHNDNVFVLQVNNKTGAYELSWQLQSLLGMLIPNTEAYDAVLAELAAGNYQVFELFTGMYGRVNLGRKKGYSYAEPQNDGTYVVRNVAKPEDVYVGASIEDAQKQAEEAGLKKAFLNVMRYTATHGEANVKLLSQAMANLHKPKAQPFGMPAGKVAGFGRGV